MSKHALITGITGPRQADKACPGGGGVRSHVSGRAAAGKGL